MTTTTTINDKNDSWGLDNNTLDDWLENDLKQSNLFQNKSKKCSLEHIIIQETPEFKQEEIDQSSPSIPEHLTRLVKMYSLLKSANNQDRVLDYPSVNNNANHIASAPPSPSMSASSSSITTSINKKKRGNNRSPMDELRKRQRNTDAARRSRLKKVEKMESLELKVDALKTDNDRLRVKVAVLEAEICQVTEKEKRNRQRVLDLEAQLANTHKQLLQDFQQKST